MANQNVTVSVSDVQNMNTAFADYSDDVIQQYIDDAGEYVQIFKVPKELQNLAAKYWAAHILFGVSQSEASSSVTVGPIQVQNATSGGSDPYLDAFNNLLAEYGLIPGENKVTFY